MLPTNDHKPQKNHLNVNFLGRIFYHVKRDLMVYSHSKIDILRQTVNTLQYVTIR